LKKLAETSTHAARWLRICGGHALQVPATAVAATVLVNDPFSRLLKKTLAADRRP
jgi:hypothetical protein